MCCGASIRAAGRRVFGTRKSTPKIKLPVTTKEKTPPKVSQFEEHLATLPQYIPEGVYYKGSKDVKEDVSTT